MDHEVARTLGELELKLRELERELAELGKQTAEPETERTAGGAPASLPPLGATPGVPRAPQPRVSQPRTLGQPPRSAVPPATAGRLVDEAVEPPPAQPPPVAPPPVEPTPGEPPPAPPIEAPPLATDPPRRYSMDAQETAFGEIPATRDARETIDLAELVRFRDKLQGTLQELIDEYSRLLSLGPRR